MKMPKSPPPPAPSAPAPMPDPNSPSILESRRRASEAMMTRAGRASTILSADNNGGGDYSATKLGG